MLHCSINYVIYVNWSIEWIFWGFGCMNSPMEQSAKAVCQVVPPARAEAGWKVRISDTHRIQFISGFGSKDEATRWIAEEAEAWLLKVEQTRLGL